MRFTALALILAAAVAVAAGCGVETIEIERQPASAFSGEASDTYASAKRYCERTGKNLAQLARDVGVFNPKAARADKIAREYATGEDDTETASALYSGCLDGIDARGK